MIREQTQDTEREKDQEHEPIKLLLPPGQVVN